MNRLNNALIFLVIVVSATLWTYVMFFREGGIPVDEERFVQAIEQRLADNAPQLKQEAKTLAADVLPPLGEAIYEQARRDQPRYLRVATEQSDQFGDNVQAIFVDTVRGQYRDYLRRHRNVLAEEFPEHAGEEALDRMMAEFDQVADNVVKRYYIDEFERESQQTLTYWRRFQPLQPPAEDEPPLEEQLTDYLADWSVLAFTDEAQRQVVGEAASSPMDTQNSPPK